MSGYFRRLAERALSAAPPVHSIAGRVYAPIPAAREIEIISDDDVKPLPAAVPETESAAPPDRDAMPPKPHEPMTSPIRPNAELRRSEPHDIATSINPPSDQSAGEVFPSVPRHERTDRQSPERLPAQPIPVEVFHPRVWHPGERELIDEFVPLVKTVTVLDPTAHQAGGSPVDARPLSPVKPQFNSPMTRHSSDRIFDRPAPEANEVHVTIGRIEITAVHAPTPSKPAPTPVRQPMSLDEYLAKRNRGSHE